jgi:hypothetical protein
VKFESLVELLAAGVGAYASAGLLFALAFVTRGVARIDGQAQGTGIFFRLIIVPGTVALWPLLLKRWISAQQIPGERQ